MRNDHRHARRGHDAAIPAAPVTADAAAAHPNPAGRQRAAENRPRRLARNALS